MPMPDYIIPLDKLVRQSKMPLSGIDAEIDKEAAVEEEPIPEDSLPDDPKAPVSDPMTPESPEP